MVEEKYAGGDATKYILSINMQRRHLTDAQRAMIAAQMANLRHGSNRHTLDTPDGVSSSPVTKNDVKQLLHVSEGSLSRAIMGTSTRVAKVHLELCQAESRYTLASPDGEASSAVTREDVKQLLDVSHGGGGGHRHGHHRQSFP